MQRTKMFFALLATFTLSQAAALGPSDWKETVTDIVSNPNIIGNTASNATSEIEVGHYYSVPLFSSLIHIFRLYRNVARLPLVVFFSVPTSITLVHANISLSPSPRVFL